MVQSYQPPAPWRVDQTSLNSPSGGDLLLVDGDELSSAREERRSVQNEAGDDAQQHVAVDAPSLKSAARHRFVWNALFTE